MNPMRQLSRKTWMNYLILGVFLLWSGMFICMLPSPAGHTGAHLAGISAPGAHAWHSDCVGGKVQTFCKSEGRTGLLGSLQGLADIDTGAFDRLFVFPVSTHVTFAPPTHIGSRFLSIFLIFCSFLK